MFLHCRELYVAFSSLAVMKSISGVLPFCHLFIASFASQSCWFIECSFFNGAFKFAFVIISFWVLWFFYIQYFLEVLSSFSLTRLPLLSSTAALRLGLSLPGVLVSLHSVFMCCFLVASFILPAIFSICFILSAFILLLISAHFSWPFQIMCSESSFLFSPDYAS